MGDWSFRRYRLGEQREGGNKVRDQSGSRRVTLFDCFGPACRCCRSSLHLDPRRSLRRPPSRHRLHQSCSHRPLQPGLPLRGAAHPPRAATPLEPRPHRPPDRRPSSGKEEEDETKKALEKGERRRWGIGGDGGVSHTHIISKTAALPHPIINNQVPADKGNKEKETK